MSNSRSVRNWLEILDSRHALRKHFYPKKPIVAGSALAQASEHEEWPLNSDWQMARVSTHLAEGGPVKKSSVSLPKRMERKIWSKPALVELTKTAVRTERAKASAMKFQEKLQAKKIKLEKTELLEESQKPQKTQKPQRAPLWQPKSLPPQVHKKPPTGVHRRHRSIPKSSKRAAKASAINLPKTSKSEVSANKTPSSVRKTRKAKAVGRLYSGRTRNILVVDANTEPGLSRPNRGGAEQPMDANGGQGPRRSKRSYGVPLCHRPTKILGMGYPYSRHMQMRQEQLYQQPEYRDQYMRMLHQQQRQHEMRQLEQYYGQAGEASMATSPYTILPQHQKKYAVPAKMPLKGLKMGKRLCGNFYYD